MTLEELLLQMQQTASIEQQMSALNLPTPTEQNAALAEQQVMAEDQLANENRAPQNWFTKALDLFSRGQYFSAKFADVLAGHSGSIDERFGQAFKEGIREFVNPQQRLSYKDIIESNYPEFAKNHPGWATVAGIIGDIAIDPTTYMSFGTSGARKLMVGGTQRVLSKEGTKLADDLARAISKEDFSGLPSHVRTAIDAVTTAEVEFEKKLFTKYGDYVAKKGVDPEAMAEVVHTTYPGALREINKLDMVHDTVEKTLEHMIMHGGDELVQKFGVKLPFLPRFEFDKVPGLKKLVDTLSVPLKHVDGIIKDWKHIGKVETAIRMFKKNFRFNRPDLAEPYLRLDDQMWRKGFETIDLMEDEALHINELLKQTVQEDFVKLAKTADLDKLKHFLAVTDEAIGQFHAMNPGKIMPVAVDDLGNVTKQYVLRYGYNRLADPAALGRTQWETDILTTLAQRNQYGKFDSPRDINNLIRTYFLNKTKNSDIFRDEGYNTFLKLYGKYKHILDTNQDHLYTLKLMSEKKNNMLLEEWKSISNPDIYQKYKSFKAGELSLEEADNMGLLDTFQRIVNLDTLGKHDYNAAVDLTLKTIDARKRLNDFYTTKHLETIFGATSRKFLPKEIKNAVKFSEDVNYSMFNRNPGLIGLAKGIDKVNSFFRFFPTVGNPAFGVKNYFVQNPMQLFATLGTKLFGMVDMDSLQDAAILSAKNFDPSLVPEGTLESIMRKDVFDTPYSLKDAEAIAQKYGWAQGASLAKDKLQTQVEKDMLKTEFSKRISNKPWLNLLKTVGNYTNWPSLMEDHMRIALGLNALKKGWGPKEATKIINEALFPYTHGLSEFERQIARRLTFFYSFPRFAIPLVLKTALKQPGRVSTVNDIVMGIPAVWEKLQNKENLTESERYLLGKDYVFEQPHAFEGFDRFGLAQNRTFPSFSFLDALEMFNLDGKGDEGIDEGIRRVILGNLAPWIKIPAELLMNRRAFSDEAIINLKAAKKRNLGNLDIGSFVGAMLGMGLASKGPLGGVAQGATLYAGGKLLTDNEIGEEFIKSIFGLEEGFDPTTKQKTLYINPTKMYFLTTVMPYLSKVVRISKDDTSYTDKALEIMFGLPKYKANLEQKKNWFNIDQFDEVKRLQGIAKFSAQRELEDDMEKALEDLRLLIDRIQYDQERINLTPVRGPGGL